MPTPLGTARLRNASTRGRGLKTGQVGNRPGPHQDEDQEQKSPHQTPPPRAPPRPPPAPPHPRLRISHDPRPAGRVHGGAQHFRPRPAELQVPAAFAQGPPLPTPARAESQNSPRDAEPRNRTKPAGGGGERPGSRRTRGRRAGGGCRAPPGLGATPRAAAAGSGDGGLRPRDAGKVPPGLVAGSPAARSPSPGAPQALPHSGANLGLGHRSGFAVRGRRRDAALSRFPEAPGADGFLSAAREAGARSPALPWGRARGGGGAPRDNDRFEAGLGRAPLSGGSPRPASRLHDKGGEGDPAAERGSAGSHAVHGPCRLRRGDLDRVRAACRTRAAVLFPRSPASRSFTSPRSQPILHRNEPPPGNKARTRRAALAGLAQWIERRPAD
ncbi:translation initiation factor IF-2-like [Myotis myotis]|uniref:translation initiation factor IF-2-like n=1 Tax=Myotis myotis TaxID=51298 RepID=UPI00174A4364|nr:translation initiation factor IF-2-like [Myotis myotis]